MPSRSNEPSLLADTLAFAVDAIEALEKLAADPDIGERLTRLELVPARPARYGETEKPLHPEVVERLATRGAERLYRRRRIGSGEVLETVALDLPPRTLSTRAGWYTVPVEVVLGLHAGGW